MSQDPRHAAYLFEHCVEHGLVVVEGDGADERPAELVYVAQGHGGEVHFLEGCPAITFLDTLEPAYKVHVLSKKN